MLGLLPLIFFLSTAIIVGRHFKTGRRVSLLLSACLSGILITFITEILSLFKALSFIPVLCIWSVASFTTLIFALPDLQKPLIQWDWQKFSRDEKILFFLIGTVITITGITALISVPNTWDSLVYHLPRILHWIQDKTIAYYPTNIIRQLYYCPWAEYAIAQLWILHAPESSANLVQWMSMLGSVVVVSLITKQFGASRQGQLLACLAAVTLPMSIVQSVSTQTDYAVTFWLLCFVFFLSHLRHNFKALFVVAAGASLGLALLSKGYSSIIAAPFLIWFVIDSIKNGHGKRVGAILVIILLAVALNAGYFHRNAQSFHSFTGGSKDDLVNASFDYKVLVGNLLRNASMHLSSPSEKVNHLLEKGVLGLSHLLRIDMNDPRALFYQRPFEIVSMSQEEATTGNFLHFFIFGFILMAFCFLPEAGIGLRVYLLLICCAAILFCWIVRWQPWISRFHLVLFILFCPACGIFFERIAQKWAIPMGIILFICALPWLFCNWEHPWVGAKNIWTSPRVDQYFRKKDSIEEKDKRVVAQIQASGCHDVGIIIGYDAWEYPLWVLLKKSVPAAQWRIEHVQVDNVSQGLSYPLGSFSPCAVIDVEKGVVTLKKKFYKG